MKTLQKIYCSLTIFVRAWYNGLYTMKAKPMKTLELHYPLSQFLITIKYMHAGIADLFYSKQAIKCYL